MKKHIFILMVVFVAALQLSAASTKNMSCPDFSGDWFIANYLSYPDDGDQSGMGFRITQSGCDSIKVLILRVGKDNNEYFRMIDGVSFWRQSLILDGVRRNYTSLENGFEFGVESVLGSDGMRSWGKQIKPRFKKIGSNASYILEERGLKFSIPVDGKMTSTETKIVHWSPADPTSPERFPQTDEINWQYDLVKVTDKTTLPKHITKVLTYDGVKNMWVTKRTDSEGYVYVYPIIPDSDLVADKLAKLDKSKNHNCELLSDGYYGYTGNISTDVYGYYVYELGNCKSL